MRNGPVSNEGLSQKSNHSQVGDDRFILTQNRPIVCQGTGGASRIPPIHRYPNGRRFERFLLRTKKRTGSLREAKPVQSGDGRCHSVKSGIIRSLDRRRMKEVNRFAWRKTRLTSLPADKASVVPKHAANLRYIPQLIGTTTLANMPKSPSPQRTGHSL